MPAFLLNPWVIGGTLAFFGLTDYFISPKGNISDEGEFITNPEFDIPDPDPSSGIMDYLDSGFSGEKKGLFALSVIGIILYSKPWK